MVINDALKQKSEEEKRLTTTTKYRSVANKHRSNSVNASIYSSLQKRSSLQNVQKALSRSGVKKRHRRTVKDDIDEMNDS